jgi:hypothetical protein
MKNLLLIVLFFGAFASVKAQKASDLATDAICDCMKNKKNVDKSKEGIQKLIMNCFISSSMDKLEGLQQEMGIESTDPKGYEEVGRRIGMKLVTRCPYFMELMSSAMENDPSMLKSKKGDDEDAAPAKTSQGTTAGVFKKVDGSDLYKLIIAEDQGRERDYYWLEPFQGDQVFIDNSSKMKNQKINVTWIEREIYLPKAKGYFKVRVIQKVMPE